jgi:hypothetical protein
MQVGPRAWGGSGGDDGAAIPPELAQVTDLGRVRQVFVGVKNVLVLPIVLCSVGVALTLGGVSLAVFVAPGAAIGLALPAVILFVMGAISLITLVGAARAIVTYEHGFAALVGNRAVSWRWEDVVAIYSNERMVSGKRSFTHIKSYALVHHSGVRLPIEGERFQDIGTIIKTLKNVIEPKILASARRAYDAGARVPFGPVTVSKEAIVLAGRSIVWTQVASVNVKDGRLVITREGGATTQVKVKNIPNIEALGALIGVDPTSMDLEFY